ncbi:hypothetical protein ABZ815_50195, partial [Nonomuraea sp. NPDC047529]
GGGRARAGPGGPAGAPAAPRRGGAGGGPPRPAAPPAAAAAGITVPVRFLLQWDDERVPRAEALALFDALSSAEKTLHANPGGHGDVPDFELDDALRFLADRLR